jgi:predicted component of type VI protein secretion system
MRVAAFLLSLLVSGCAVTPAPRDVAPIDPGRVRVTALADEAALTLSATLEGSDGQALSGALVTVTDPSGAVQLVPYDSRRAAYVLTTPVRAGAHAVSVDSRAVSALPVTVPVLALTPRPDVLGAQDALGRDTRDLARLSAAQTIRLNWQPTVGAARYLVEARQFGRTVATVQTSDAQVLLPANTFRAENDTTGSPATVVVTATTQSGDLTFRTAPYFSVTSVTGRSLTFGVLP